jgi:hypothetical protein
VYLSHDSYYGRDVAIKAYRIAADDDPARAKVARKMFLSEAHMVGMLQHPNIMPIYDAGEESGYYWVVTEFIHGARTLSAYTRPDNLLPVEDVLTLMFKCAKALHYAHSRGVIHRDIKPSNLMLTTDSDLRLIDFGIALHNDADFSRIEGIAGSPSYMSPEQVQSLELTNHSDIYSLGAVMYELLTGHRHSAPARSPSSCTRSSMRRRRPCFLCGRTCPGTRDSRCDGDAQGAGQSATRTARSSRMRSRACTPCSARTAIAATAGALQLAAAPQVLPRLLVERDLGSAARRHLAGPRARRRDCPRRRHRRPLLRDRERQLQCRARRQIVGRLEAGDCFGETSYLRGAKRQAAVIAGAGVTILRVSSTLLEQASSACQLRFNKVFLKSLISRLQNGESRTVS